MENLLLISTIVSVALSGLTDSLSALASDSVTLLAAGSGLTLALALGTVTYSNIPGEVLASVRRWHGNIDDQYDNIDNLVNTINNNPSWNVPKELIDTLGANRSSLSILIARCRSVNGSSADRTVRNSLLKTTVGLCLTQAKVWAYTEYYAGALTADDVHLLGFLLPGETGGRHDRTEPTNVLAEVKPAIVNMDFIRVVIDQASTENAALVVHGWPPGVRQALIVIVAADGKTEVLRQLTTRLHNDIQMPEGSHGKQFIIKAAFLKHIDDEPKFGPEPTFSMPLSTEDLAAMLDRQHHEEFEAQLREVERQRQEIERLKQAHDDAGEQPK
jgi:hypothetical protein